MSTPIKIDLRDLTDEHVAHAMPSRGQCLYAAPCIIGSLIDPIVAQQLDDETGEASIDCLVDDGLVEFPAGQLPLAVKLQCAFDDTGLESNDAFLATLAEVRAELGAK